jgi:hypothetical protein
LIANSHSGCPSRREKWANEFCAFTKQFSFGKILFMDSPVAVANQSGPWLAKTSEKDWHVNWHDVGVASVILLGAVTCVAVMAAFPVGGVTLLAMCAANSVGEAVGATLIGLGIYVILGGVMLLDWCHGHYSKANLSFKAHDNEVVKPALSGENGLIQRLVNAGNLTQVDLGNFTKAYEELKKVIPNPGTKTFSAFNPNSPAMAEVLHYLFLHGNADIVRDATKLISDIVPELTKEAAEKVLNECFPCIKEAEQLAGFLAAFFECKCLPSASFWNVIFDPVHSGGALISKLASIKEGEQLSKFLLTLLECKCPPPANFWSMIFNAAHPGGALIHKFASIKEDEQLSKFLLTFLKSCQHWLPANLWNVIFDPARPGGALIHKLAKTSDAKEDEMRALETILKSNPDITRKLLNGDFKELDPNAIMLFIGATKNHNAILMSLPQKLESGEINREMVLKVLRMKDAGGNLLALSLFFILPTGRQLAYKIFEKWNDDNLLSLKNDAGDPLIISLILKCYDVESKKQFLDFIARFPSEKQVQLLNEKDHLGRPLIEYLSVNVEKTQLVMDLMEILTGLKNTDKISGVDFSRATACPILAKMLKIIGINPPRGAQGD